MRIGFYGMPTAGKTFILDRIDFLEVVVGSKLLRQYDPEFDKRDEAGRKKVRRDLANIMLLKEEFIMDGHYAFGNETAFTEEDGNMYDVYLYLYVDPIILEQRMAASPKNSRYLNFNIAVWQNEEINNLRAYCHKHNKDFYVIDNPPENSFDDVSDVIEFIRAIKNGYSCIAFAQKCAADILAQSSDDNVVLLDGDKTLTIEDSSNQVFSYTTHLYDGNFYTGYQVWKQSKEFRQYIIPQITEMPVHINEKVLAQIGSNACILTSGHEMIWSYISDYLHIPFFCGVQMSAETKLFITKFLQAAGKTVTAFGDGMNDYYMMKAANKGYLVTKQNGSISKSLEKRDLEGLILV